MVGEIERRRVRESGWRDREKESQRESGRRTCRERRRVRESGRIGRERRRVRESGRRTCRERWRVRQRVGRRVVGEIEREREGGEG